jgi:lipopolysaccharide/colanic/teichoic acid biosynthesis glycosyltransferase
VKHPPQASLYRRFGKRALDIVVAATGLALTCWIVALAACLARFDTGASGLFRQWRIGKGGAPFQICKIRSMRVGHPLQTTATAANDPRITPLGRWLRRTKIDELPQLWNVLVGDMSLVGPRPETPEHLDLFLTSHPEVLSVRPGITCPATLRFRCEEALLMQTADPEGLNRRMLLPCKMRLNAAYAAAYTLRGDLMCILHTLVGSGPRYRLLAELPETPLTSGRRDVA